MQNHPVTSFKNVNQAYSMITIIEKSPFLSSYASSHQNREQIPRKIDIYQQLGKNPPFACISFFIFEYLPSQSYLFRLFCIFVLTQIIIFSVQMANAFIEILLSVIMLLSLCADCKLIYLFSLIRHGAIYPKTGLYDGNETKQLQGKLTPIGMRQQYNLGSYLKSIYIDEERLTTLDFNPIQVEFFSSTVDRTSVSSLSLINGFFPLKKRLQLPLGISEELLLPPYAKLFPDHLRSQNTQDKQLPPPSPHSTLHVLDACDNYDNLKKASQAEVRNKSLELEQSQKQIIDRLMKTFNLNTSHADSNGLSDLYKEVYAKESLGRPLPSDFTEEERRSLNYIYKYYNALIHQGNFLRYIITPTLQFVEDKLRAASNKTRTMKMSFVSLHESSSWPYLLILNLTNPDCIQQQFKGEPVTSLNCVEDLFFSSSILFELHEDVAFRQYVMVKYNGEYVNLCERNEIQCPAEEFLQRLKNIEIDYSQACKLPPNAARPVHHRSMIIH